MFKTESIFVPAFGSLSRMFWQRYQSEEFKLLAMKRRIAALLRTLSPGKTCGSKVEYFKAVEFLRGIAISYICVNRTGGIKPAVIIQYFFIAYRR